MVLKHISIEFTKACWEGQNPPTRVEHVLEGKFNCTYGQQFSPAGYLPSLREMATTNKNPSRQAIQDGDAAKMVGSLSKGGEHKSLGSSDPNPWGRAKARSKITIG